MFIEERNHTLSFFQIKYMKDYDSMLHFLRTIGTIVMFPPWPGDRRILMQRFLPTDDANLQTTVKHRNAFGGMEITIVDNANGFTIQFDILNELLVHASFTRRGHDPVS